MSSKDKILDGVAQFAGGAMGAIQGAKEQAKTTIRSGVDSFAQDMDLVPREDFERLEAMLIKAREEQDELVKRIAVLEEKVSQK